MLKTMTPYPTDDESLARDTDIEFIRDSGPGGQHRNKVETGVRLRHRPSGVVVKEARRRSQARNREAAFARLTRASGGAESAAAAPYSDDRAPQREAQAPGGQTAARRDQAVASGASAGRIGLGASPPGPLSTAER